MISFRDPKLWIGLILLAAIFGLFGNSFGESIFPKEKEISECGNKFSLLEPTLDCDRVAETKGKVFIMKSNVTEYIEERETKGGIRRASVFYRDLTTRQWFGINADDEYYPASLAKLPLAVTYYKVGELDPSVLESPLLLDGGKEFTNQGQTFGTDSPMIVGKSYSVKDMIENLIMYSDNRPIGPLTRAMNPAVWKKTAEDLGIRKQTSTGGEEWAVTPRLISAVLRSLYNASYLEPASSEELLSIMTRAKFTGGIVAGVPDSVKVAHKFGEATIEEKDGTKTPTLHDCGIVYKPGKPYILCVMTEGKDFAELEKTIAEISFLVHKAQ